MLKTAATITIALMTTSVQADWKCTMPNGRVIYKQLSACPSDATKKEEVTSVPEHVKPELKGSYIAPAATTHASTQPKPSPQTPQHKQPQTPTPAGDIIDQANRICAALRRAGATSCEVEVNIFSASYIEATLNTNPAEAQLICLGIANQTRRPDSPFAGRGWQMRIQTPYSVRPVAVCSL